MKINWFWVKAHSTDKFNNMVDELARSHAISISRDIEPSLTVPTDDTSAVSPSVGKKKRKKQNLVKMTKT
jgi:hypothetical protein